MFDYRARFVFSVVLLAFCLSACVHIKETGRTIGHTTRDVTREIGHGARDVTREIGHGTRDAANTVGEGVKKVVKPTTAPAEY